MTEQNNKLNAMCEMLKSAYIYRSWQVRRENPDGAPLEAERAAKTATAAERNSGEPTTRLCGRHAQQESPDRFKERAALDQLWDWLPGENPPGENPPGESQSRAADGSLQEGSQPDENQNSTLEPMFGFSGLYAWTPQEQ